MENVIDNFLNFNDFQHIVNNTIETSDFPYYKPGLGVSSTTSNDGIYFIHMFYGNNQESNTFPIIQPILNRLEIKKLIRCQLNLYPRTFFRKYHDFHVDLSMKHRGCILYLNTNDGFTVLKGRLFNKKIKSVENRALFFNPGKKHCSSTCTNEHFRANIIFNYM